MEEKRRSKRFPVHIQLCISDLFKQDTTGIHDLDSPIEVIDISRDGIGFISKCILPVGYYFNAKLDLYDSTSPAVFTVVKIVRCESYDMYHYHYGCEFTHPAEDVYALLEMCSDSMEQRRRACIWIVGPYGLTIQTEFEFVNSNS